MARILWSSPPEGGRVRPRRSLPRPSWRADAGRVVVRELKATCYTGASHGRQYRTLHGLRWRRPPRDSDRGPFRRSREGSSLNGTIPTAAEGASAGSRMPAPGAVLDGKYVIEHTLGKGGMGTVFAARICSPTSAWRSSGCIRRFETSAKRDSDCGVKPRSRGGSVIPMWSPFTTSACTRGRRFS